MSKQAKTWVRVPGWESYYEVSDHGDVRSLPRERPHWRGGTASVPGQMLRPVELKFYMKVTLCAEGVRKDRYVHGLVAEAFLGPRPEGLEVLHRDGNPKNNKLSNLHYGTDAENIRDTVSHGTHRNSRKMFCKRKHALAGANLWEYENTKTGGPQRVCRSCNLARQAGKRQPWWPDEEKYEQLADAYYRELTA